ncbi:neuronal acetylcholine receptor subunit non-alpha-2-like, partial [Pecten maximus]|uniref:neuronal acetylcholine receptor subunit non-alpha-2-like n=1 Tax=Pecten maximus TaxID=6579 RepID=UPI0014586711
MDQMAIIADDAPTVERLLNGSSLCFLQRSHPVKVQLGLSLHTIRDLDEKNQVLTIKAYFVLFRVDQFLVWNSTQYDNTEFIMVPLRDIWIPDAGIYNGINSFETITDTRSYIGVFPDGSIIWTPGGDYSILCDVSVWNYPFDSQTCVLEVGPKFSHHSMQLFTAMFDKVDLVILRENSEWEFLSSDCNCRVSDLSTSTCDIRMTIQRRPEHFVLHLVSPVILLAVMNPVTFLIPPTS